MVWMLGVCLLASFAAGWPATTESSHVVTQGSSITPKVDINKTIIEVEKILDKYPELPRIERSEILSILQNITEEDNVRLKEELSGVLEEEKQKLQKSLKEKEKPKKDKQKNRSVMVVLPFQADDSEESLEELYTRRPIVRMEEEKERKVITTTPKATTTTTTEQISTEPPAFSIIEKEDPKFNPPLRIIGYRYHTTSSPRESSSVKTYLNYQDPEQVTMAFPTQENKVGKVWNHKDDPPEIIFNEDIKPEWESHPSSKDSMQFHAPEIVDNFSLEDILIPKDIMKTPQTTTKAPTTTFSSITTTILPTTITNDLAFVTEATTTPRMFITPMSVKTDTKEKEIVTSTTEFPRKKYRTKPKLEKTTKAPKVDNLASVVDTLPSQMQHMLIDLGLNSKSITSTTTTEAPKRHAVPSLNPEIDPSSYLKFKPLPIKRQKTIPDDMQDFLASFGLLDGFRHQKAVPDETTEIDDKFLETAPEINTDILSDNMKKTLESLGLYDRSEGSSSKKHIFNPNNHTSIQTEEEVKKLNALLNTIKKLASLNDTEPVSQEFQKEILQQVQELDNITTSYKTSLAINEEIHKIMLRNKGKFKIPLIMHESTATGNLNKGPEPEFFEEIQLKNEVKRQQDNSTTEEPESTSTSTTTEPANSPDLEDAFGGGDTAAADSDPVESLPPKRPNGLYLLLDWNTFFEVGTDDDARRVNIRFQPKVGDSRNFLPVSIP